MTEDRVPVAGPPPGWQLLTELTVASLHGDTGPLLDTAIAAVHGVNLSLRQTERIRHSLIQAIAGATRRDATLKSLPLRIRIWRMGSCVGDCGWGYFLVQKQISATAASMEHVVELFLYQEREC